MDSLSMFEFPDSQQEIGVYIDNSDRPWFRVTNVCAVLGFANPVVAIQTHCPDNYKEYKIGMGRPSNYVSESGLYRLMFASKAPIAERFRDWVCDDVLPAIRKTGHFGNVPNHESEASEFWQLIDGAIARGLEPERAIDLRRQYEGKAAATPPNLRKVQVSKTRLVAVPDLQKFCRDVGLIESKGSEIGVTELWSLLQKWQVQNDVVLVRKTADLFRLISIAFPSVERTKHPKTRRSLLRNLAIA